MGMCGSISLSDISLDRYSGPTSIIGHPTSPVCPPTRSHSSKRLLEQRPSRGHEFGTGVEPLTGADCLATDLGKLTL